MRKYSKLVVGLVCALALVTSAFAATNTPVTVTSVPSTYDWVMSIGGSGSTTTSGDNATALGVNLAVGRTFKLLFPAVLPAEVGLRQFYGYAAEDSTSLASTKLYLDVTVLKFNLTKTVPVDVLVGVNGGPTYGNTPLLWTVAPEVGFDVWLAKNVALDARIEFPFIIGDHSQAANVLNYVIGVKFKL